MKVAFVCFDSTRFGFLSGLYALFRNHGHEVMAFYEHNVAPNHTKCNWLSFEMGPIDAFKPDRVIIFNGWAAESSAAAAYLMRRYKTFFVERAWLPQSMNIYIDPEGLGGRSSLAKRDLSILPEGSTREDAEKTVQMLKTKFKPGPDPGWGEYILVPLQVEKDSQIVIDSPYFKTMKSLANYVCWRFGDKKIVLKTHPEGEKFDHAFAVSGPDMNTLAYHAKAIVGINSTSLIEALVHNKPVISFGRGVLSGSNVFMDAEVGFKAPRSVLAYTPDADRVAAVLHNLYSLQFSREAPPASVIKKVEG